MVLLFDKEPIGNVHKEYIDEHESDSWIWEECLKYQMKIRF